ncbi:MAG TPA: ABC transporter ATP-binding protein, partial [Alphaproteobacteria bacterium]|nr:ABC transporter ATP-binding protein [Alphaproteobacteria bacterium]
MTGAAPLLEIDRLVIGGADGTVPIVDDLSLTIGRADSLGIAGESGCGKSTLLLAMMGIVKPGLRHRAGGCRFDGMDLLKGDDRALEKLRGGRVALIPQNAGTALTPNIRIGDQIGEVLALHTDLAGDAMQKRVVQLLRQVRLPTPERLGRRFPHELSGGQLQRVGIAMALAGEPELLLLDEPTTGLDVTTQLGILHLLADLRRERNVAMICVSHDLGVIATLSDRVAIMYSGRIIEAGPTVRLLRQPAHPYSRALLASIPRISTARIPLSIEGRPPTPQQMLPGCRFAPRCGFAAADCLSGAPDLVSTDGENWVACRHPQSGAVDGALAAAESGLGLAPAMPQIAIDDLSVTYQRRGILDVLLPRAPGKLAVDHLSLVLRKGEVLGLVGESGSGKSTILKAISGLWPVLAGKATFGDGTDLAAPVGARDRATLRAVQLIFQNPDASLNPRHSVREILAQPLRLYFGLSAGEIAARAATLLKDVKLDASYLDRYPGDLSGGERQRVAIAR